MDNLKIRIERYRSYFSNYNIIRMREAIRYLTPQKLEIFIKIPFLLHINVSEYPGFSGSRTTSHGIWNFENSGFYKEAVKTRIFPKSVIETLENENPAILGLYHIGSLGTFTQSIGSDFDFWVIIDKKKYSKTRYRGLEEKLDAVVRYSREAYDQEVTFFIMDHEDIKNDCYASFEGEETLTVPKIFLKEEFYRTFLMIAGKIPVWCVRPNATDSDEDAIWKAHGTTTQILSMYEDLIDLGHISKIPEGDGIKGLLWHICKSKYDPVKALIKATMVFSYQFDHSDAIANGLVDPMENTADAISGSSLLCDKIKQDYAKAGVDEYDVDPYKALFDRILDFHETHDPEQIHIIKNAIFFRLCEYPDVIMPEKGSPKFLLLNEYIRSWKLSRNQVKKLLSYITWSEQEKLLLEKTIINRLAQMFNAALKKVDNISALFDGPAEQRNWNILKNKIRERLRKSDKKIPECTTYLKRRGIVRFDIKEKSMSWELEMTTSNALEKDLGYQHSNLLGILGWIMENELYNRHVAKICIDTGLKLFESVEHPLDPDKLYMRFQPLKPLSDSCFEKGCAWAKMMILLTYDKKKDYPVITKAEFLVSNTWGELFLESLEFDKNEPREEQLKQMVNKMTPYASHNLKLFIFQLSKTLDPEIVYQLKKAYSERIEPESDIFQKKAKPYLDRL